MSPRARELSRVVKVVASTLLGETGDDISVTNLAVELLAEHCAALEALCNRPTNVVLQ